MKCNLAFDLAAELSRHLLKLDRTFSQRFEAEFRLSPLRNEGLRAPIQAPLCPSRELVAIFEPETVGAENITAEPDC
jgi:hypothetical protein